MLTLVIVVSILFIIISSIVRSKIYLDEESEFALGTISIICYGIIIIGVIANIILLTNIASENVIDNKIIMYQEENTRIENEIDDIVNAYMLFENDTLKNLKVEGSTMTLATFYPELKSNELVQRQIEIHTDNNSKIKNLREKKIELGTKKWLVYFGK